MNSPVCGGASQDMATLSILYMEDDPGMARLFQKRLSAVGHTVVLARDGEEGLAILREQSFDIVAVDQQMPSHSGLEVIRILHDEDDHPPIIMVTGGGNEETAVAAMKHGASDYIVKDADGGYLDLLPSVINRVMSQRRLADENERTLIALQDSEERYRQLAHELHESNVELDAFAHTVAHDLKSPLTVITGFSELLANPEIELESQARQDYLRRISTGARKMRDIIDELLLLSKLRKAEVEIGPLDTPALVNEARTRLSYLIEDAGAEIVQHDSWPRAMGHGPWIEQVWTNYLSNALKYGGRPPQLELGADTNGEQVRFWVRDQGPGLTKEEQARLFTPFTQLGKTRSEGQGLGLSIVRRILEKLGGEAGVQSQEGQGSLFYFTLPAER